MSNPDIVAIVEDDPLLREELSCFLAESDCQVFEANDFTSFVDVVQWQKLHVAVLDLNLPGGHNGFDIAQWVRNKMPQVGIIMLTARGGLSDRVQGYESGADIYFSKPVEPIELLAAIRRLAQRAKSPPSHEPTFVLEVINRRVRGDFVSCDNLTPIEVALLRALSVSRDQQLEIGELLNLLDHHANTRDITRRALENLISRLRTKLKTCFDSDNDPIRAIRGFGYQLTWKVQIVD